MNGLVDSVAVWLADYLLLATVLLALVLAALAAVAQPVRRLVVVKSTLVAVGLVAVLCAVPGWSVVHLMTAAEENAAADGWDGSPADSPHESIAGGSFDSRLPADGRAPIQVDESNMSGNSELAASSADRPVAAPGPGFPWPTIAVSSYAAGSSLVLLWLAIGAMAAYRLRRSAMAASPELAKVFAELTHRGLWPQPNVGRALLPVAEVTGRSARPTDNVSCLQRIEPLVVQGAPRAPRLFTSDRVDTAIALGVFRPVVILPRGWTGQKSASDLRSVLAHEWTHVKNGDLQWLAVCRALLVLLWVQPLYWLLRRRMRLDQEALADAAAADTTGRQTYAAELVAWARAATAQRRMPIAAAVGLWEGPSQLRRRIALLLDERFTVLRTCSRGWRLLAAIGLVTTAFALSLVTFAPALPQLGEAETNSPANSLTDTDGVGVMCVDAQGQPVGGAEIHLFQHGGKDRGYLHFGPFSTDDQGRAVFEQAVFSDEAGFFDRWMYARVPGRLVGVARSVKWKDREPINAEGKVVLQPSRSVEGQVTVPPGFDPQNVLVFVRTMHVFIGPGEWDYQSFPREHFFPGLDTALPEIFERRPDADGRIRFGDMPAQGNVYLLARSNGLGEAQWWNGDDTFDIPIELTMHLEGRLLGRVLLPDGEPAVGVNVAATLSPSRYPTKEVSYLSTFEAETDANGQFAIGGLWDKEFSVSVTDKHQEWVFRPLEDILVPSGESRMRTLTMEPGVLVSGRVLDPDGNPVEGASFSAVADTRIRPGLDSTLTDASGRYQFRLPSGRADLYFSGIPSGFVYPEPSIVERLDIESGQGPIENLDFTLRRDRNEADKEDDSEAEEGAGQVRSRAKPDNNVANSAAEAQPASATQETRVDSTQDASDAGPPTTGAGQPTRSRRARPEPNTIVGQCVDEDGQPLARVELSAYLLSQVDRTRELIGRSRSDDGGNYKFESVVDVAMMILEGDLPADGTIPPDDPLVMVVARMAGRASQQQMHPAAAIVKRGVSTMHVMKPAATLRGRVTDPDGKPVEGALVSIGAATIDRWDGLSAARTDADGRYEINDVEPFDRAEFDRQQEAKRQAARQLGGPFGMGGTTDGLLELPPVMTIDHPEFARKFLHYEKAPGAMDVQLERPAEVIGRVVYGDSGLPAKDLLVHIARHKPDPPVARLIPDFEVFEFQSWQQKTDDDGRYRFGSLPPGQYDIWTDEVEWVHPGIPRLEATPDEAAAAPDIVLTKGGIVRLHLVNAGTNELIPLTGEEEVQLTLSPRGALSRHLMIERTASVGPDGQIQMRYPGGVYHALGCVVQHESQPLWQLPAAWPINRVTEGDTLDVRLRLLRTELINARRYGHNQKPQETKNALAELVASGTKDIEVLQTWTDATNRLGEYRESMAAYERILQSDPPADLKWRVLIKYSAIFSTVADDSVRNGPRAVELAETAMQFAERQWEEADSLDALAAAQAETGDFRKAVETQMKAIELADERQQAPFREHLALYQAGQPRRIPSEGYTSVGATSQLPRPVARDVPGPQPANGGAPADQPPAGSKSAANQPVEITLIVAQHVMLLDEKKIVSREEVEQMIAALPDPSAVRINLYLTPFYMEGELERVIAGQRLMDEYRAWIAGMAQRFGCRLQSFGSVHKGWYYDAIRTPADLIPDEALRKDGVVLAPDGTPLPGAEVMRTQPAGENAGGKVMFKYLKGPHVDRRLNEAVTDTDANGRFSIYPAKDQPYYLVVLHEQGFAIVRSDVYERDGTIKVQPWARLKGRFLPDERIEEWTNLQEWGRRQLPGPFRAQAVQPELNMPGSDRWPEVRLRLHGQSVQPDENGSFEFTYVPPLPDGGVYRYIRTPGGVGLTFGAPANGGLFKPNLKFRAAPGETVSLELPPLTDEEFARFEAKANEEAARREAARARRAADRRADR